MSQFSGLARSVAPVLRIFRRRISSAMLGAAYPASIDRYLEGLEGRRLCDTPISPGLSVQYFATTDPTLSSSSTAASYSSVSDIDQTYTTNPSGGSTPFHVLYTGSIDISSDQAGRYWFQLPNAEGALLTVDNTGVIYSSSVPGDANLDGTTGEDDLETVLANFGLATGQTWATGDFDGDGAVGSNDLSLTLGNLGATATPLLINFGPNPTGAAVVVYLSAGEHNIS